jgi:hypothetical protein
LAAARGGVNSRHGYISAVSGRAEPVHPITERHVPAKKTPSAPDEGYCVKCKAKRKIDKAKEIKMANGRPALKGVCPVCGTGMFKILAPKKK